MDYRVVVDYEVVEVVVCHYGQNIDMQLLGLAQMFFTYLLACVNRRNTLVVSGIIFVG